jgi:hypothetical protein
MAAFTRTPTSGANAVGALAKKLHGERYRAAVREARAMGVL